MSGRGKGRGGRGRFQPKTNSTAPRTENKENNKSIKDWTYYIGSAKQASDYEAITDFLINQIKETYEFGNDIAMAIVNQEPVKTDSWRPTLQKSSNSDPDSKDAENEQYKMEFQADYESYKVRTQTYVNNNTKAYALFWGKCAKGMKNKIEARTDFKSNIENNPFELLKMIKEHAMSYQENRYNMSVILDSLLTLLTTRQKENESLQDYTKRFRVTREVYESHSGGPLILRRPLLENKAYKEYPINMPEHENNKLMEQQASEQLLAYAYLAHADQAKYGSILNGLITQQSLRNEQYPRNVTEANNVLSNHKFDITRSTNKNQNKNSNDQTKREPGQEKINLSFSQIEGRCFCCGKTGHKSPQCRFKDKPKSEWHFNKSQQSLAQAGKTESKEPESKPASENKQSTPSKSEGWAGVNHQLYQQENMKEWILLDNESTVTIFCNPDMVKDIKETQEESLNLVTNAGVLQTNHKATIPGWGEAWFNPHAITNIFSYAEMAKRHCITYDSKAEDAFIVHMPDKKVKFTKTDQGLYIYKPKITKSQSSEVQLLNTVNENKTFFTHQQIERAKKARELYHALGTPSPADFKAIIQLNLIVNNPISQEDIKLAEQIFGPDISSLKGKTTRKTPIPVVNDYKNIPKELFEKQDKIVLCINGITVNRLTFLTTISKNLYYRTAQFIERKTVSNYTEAIKEILQVYNKAGFRVTEIRSDNEF